MRKNKIIRKLIYSFILINFLFWNSAGSVQALFGSSISIPSFEEIADKAEKRYGFDSNLLRNSKQKGTYPTVEVFFDNTSPEKGEKVTATAMPKYFKNTNGNLYYTWLLFREGDSLSSAQVVEKAKRRAMGIVARGDFDPYLFGTSYAGSTSDPDNDGYDASFGGDDGVGGRSGTPSGEDDYESEHYLDPTSKQIVDTDEISRCYRHNFGVSEPEDYNINNSGEDLIVRCRHKFAEANGSGCNNYDVGDGDFDTGEEECWSLDPNNPDTDGDGVNDEADLAGLGQTQFTWTFQPGDRVGLMIEGTSMVVINEGEGDSGTSITNNSIGLDGETTDPVGGGSVSFEATSQTVATDVSSTSNPYYKIVWAGLDTCDDEEVEGDNKRDLIENDECENSADYGFNYIATKAVFEKGNELLKTKLNFVPRSPQVDVDNNDYSDYITVTSTFIQSGVADDFVYYDWDIYYCNEGNLDTCTEDASNRLTTACTDGDVLGECSRNGAIESNSYAEGISLDRIKFKVGDNFLADQGEYDSFFLKVFLRTKRSKNDAEVGVSSVDIPVEVNDNKIKLFEVFGPSYSFSSSDEICASGDYSQICPVFPGQIIVARADIDIDGAGSSDVEAYSWELNGQKVSAPLSSSGSCSFSGGCSLGGTVYLPMIGSGMSLQSISLKAKKDGGEEITSERLVSVAKPMAKIVSNNSSSAWPWVVDDGTASGRESSEIFVGMIGQTVSFSAELVPGYLNNNLDDNNIFLIWYLNGQKVDSTFIGDNSDYGIAVSDQSIQFQLAGEEGDSVNLMVEVEKQFSSAEENVLKDNWEIQNIDTLKTQKSITIRQTSSGGVLTQGSSIEMFAASTLANAPEYFIFMIRAAIVFVLFWVFIFGFNFWFSREIKLNK